MSEIFETQDSEFDALTDLWEASVKATHDFLEESDIVWLRPKVRNDYLKAVSLRVFKGTNNDILGFIGVANNKIEMLFVAPQALGQGVGKKLLRYAIEHMAANAVDVNEQNPRAIGFYQHLGFKIVGRSPLDGLGMPFPLVHMCLDAGMQDCA